MKERDDDIIKIKDLNNLRTAPKLNREQSRILLKEVKFFLDQTDWITIGIMAPSIKDGLDAVRSIEKRFRIKEMKCITFPDINGPIFLKANQKTGQIYSRVEYGLGEGILISCHNNDESITAETIGPFPLEFFK